jgi:hypothetical protein
MRKNKIEPKKPVEVTPVVFQNPEPIRGYYDPKPGSWTYRNYGPGGYIDASGVPCRPSWY